MSDIFDNVYADIYDAVYREKNYEQEIEAVARLLNDHATARVREILDLGCGTGRHATLLAARGFNVTGIDQSEPMLAIARERVAMPSSGDGKIALAAGDIRNLDLHRKFDAALMMFNVLGYMASNADLLAAFASVRRHLPARALFIFDLWYGPALVADPPSNRVKDFKTRVGEVKRAVETEHLPHEQRCDVTVRLTHVATTGEVAQSTTTHKVRYFFPLELDIALSYAGFRLIEIRSFPDIDTGPDLIRWPAVVIAVATEDAGQAR